MLDQIKLYIAAGVAVIFLGVGGYAWYEHGHAARLSAANDVLTKQVEEATAVANQNDLALKAYQARAEVTARVVAQDTKAVEARGQTLVQITKEVERAKAPPAGCPAVPDSLRAVARVLRDGAQSGLPGRPGDADGRPGAGGLPAAAVHPGR